MKTEQADQKKVDAAEDKIKIKVIYLQNQFEQI